MSIPIDLTGSGDEELAKIEERGVKGRYVSVERIKEIEEGRVEWRMATSSTPGGNIPTFIAEASIAKSIAQVTFCFPANHFYNVLMPRLCQDVPHFLKWLHALPPVPEPTDKSNDQ